MGKRENNSKSNEEVKSNIDTVIGKAFKIYRKKNHLTQDAIAEKLDISEKYISRLENGNSGVKMETLVNYMNILGMVPNVVFKDLITNEVAKQQIEISEKISKLPADKLEFINSMLDALNKL